MNIRKAGCFPRISWLLRVVLAVALFPLQLAAQPEVELSYLGQFGSRGSGAGQFRDPFKVDIDSQGRIWVLDELTERIQLCDEQGNCDFYRNSGGGIASFALPSDFAIDDQDRLLLLERSSSRLYICGTDSFCGNYIGGPGAALGMFNSPYGLGFNSEGRILVADTDNRRVQQCDYNGSCTAFGVFAGSTGGPGVWWSPFSIAGNSLGAIFVGEVGSPPGGPDGTGWIHTCNVQGQCSHRWGGRGTGPQNTTAPNAILGDDRGNIFVADSGNDRIKVCDYEGLCRNFGGPGTGGMEFDNPRGLALDARDRLIVADSDNARIQFLQVSYVGDDPVFRINAGLNDAWYNSATAGQGVLLTVYPGIRQVFLAWFTYDVERPPAEVTALLGDPGHRWLTAQGPYETDTAELTVYMTKGGVFDAAEPAAETDPEGIGTITLEFADCNAALMSYQIPSLGLSGEIPLQRIVTDNQSLCETLAAD